MDDVRLKTGLTLSLDACTQSVPGMSDRTAPQSGGFDGAYTYGASGAGSINQIVWMSVELAASGSLVVNLLSGAATNPLGETAQLNVLKEWAVICLPTDNSGNPTDAAGVTAAFSTTAAAAAGFAAAFTKTLVQGESVYGSYPTGRSLTGTPTITLTNLSGSGKARVLLVAAGFKP